MSSSRAKGLNPRIYRVIQHLNRNIQVWHCFVMVKINNYFVYYNVCRVSLTVFSSVLIFTGARIMNIIKIKHFYVYLCSYICDDAHRSDDLHTSVLICSMDSGIVYCENHPSPLILNRFRTKINPHFT